MTPEYFNFIGYDISIGYLEIWFGAPIHIMPCVTPGSRRSANRRRPYTPIHVIPPPCSLVSTTVNYVT